MYEIALKKLEIEQDFGSMRGKLDFIRGGISYAHVGRVADLVGMKTEALEVSLSIKANREESDVIDIRLNRSETELLLSVVEVFVLSTEVLESEDKAKQWFFETLPILENQKPVELIDTFLGIDYLRLILNQIKYGLMA